MHTYICIHMHACMHTCMYTYVYEREMAAYESRLCCSSAIYVCSAIGGSRQWLLTEMQGRLTHTGHCVRLHRTQICQAHSTHNSP